MSRIEAVKPTIKYEYENEGQYLISKYKEQIQFALFQVQSQYDSAKTRENAEIHDIKTFGISMCVIIGILPISVLCAISGGMVKGFGFFLGLFGCILLFADMPFLLYALPLCLYKVMRGFVYLQINKQNQFGIWISKKWDIPVVSNEIMECESYIRKYTMILEELDDLQDDLDRNEEIDLEKIKLRMQHTDTKPTIKTVNIFRGRVDQKIKKASIFITATVYILLILAGLNLYTAILHEITYMFQQF